MKTDPVDTDKLRAKVLRGGRAFEHLNASGYPNGAALLQAVPALLDEIDRLRGMVEDKAALQAQGDG